MNGYIMKKLKVLQIIPSFGVGGAEMVVLNYLKNYNRDKLEMRAISLYSNNNTIYDEVISREKLDVIYLDKNLGFDLSLISKLKKEIIDYNPDIIHTHLYVLKYLFLTGEIFKRKIFHTIHNEVKIDAGKDFLLNKMCFKLFNVKAVALHKRLSLEVIKIYGIKECKIIRNGIDLKKFRESKDNLRGELHIPNDAYVIGHIGAFKLQKNHKFIVQIFKHISKQFPNTYLMLIGDGELKSDIEQLVQAYEINERILFLGNREDIPELLNTMDIFLFPSLFEGLGIVLVEAQAAALRCVISDRVPKEVVLTDKIISLELEEDINRWVEAIMNFDNQNKQEIFEDIQKYDINTVIEDLMVMYLNC